MPKTTRANRSNTIKVRNEQETSTFRKGNTDQFTNERQLGSTKNTIQTPKVAQPSINSFIKT